MSFKDKYRRFRQWQRQPFDYHDSHDHHGCCNCGAESDNNYCPRCGQKAVYGPITWHSVWRGVMDVWGVGTRSLPYTLWQLVWRPGYLMRDYISGKRQVSFPPVKMLVIVGLFALLVDKWLYPNATSAVEPITSTGLMYIYDVVARWAESHYEWSALFAFSFLIVPVWIVFREAPSYPHHVLPQGFFIQVFTSTQFLLVASLILDPLSALIPSFVDDVVIGLIVLLVVPCMLLIDYKQLFGYGWWGTLWRVAMTVPFGILFYRILERFIEATDCLMANGIVPEFWEHVMIVVDVVILIWLMVEAIGVINRKSWRKHGWWQALQRPLLVTVLSLVTGSVCYLMGVKGAIAGLVSSYLTLIGG